MAIKTWTFDFLDPIQVHFNHSRIRNDHNSQSVFKLSTKTKHWKRKTHSSPTKPKFWQTTKQDIPPKLLSRPLLNWLLRKLSESTLLRLTTIWRCSFSTKQYLCIYSRSTWPIESGFCAHLHHQNNWTKIQKLEMLWPNTIQIINAQIQTMNFPDKSFI